MNTHDPSLRLTYALALLFFLCAGTLVFFGIRTDAQMIALGGSPAAHASGAASPTRLAADGIIQILFQTALAILAIGLYFLPSINALVRHHRERVPIFLVNLLIPVIGWIIALIWSFSSQVEAEAK